MSWIDVDIVWIEESFQGMGYGIRLLNLIENIAKEKSCTFIKLNTILQLSSNLNFIKMHVDNFDRLKLPQWFRVFTGLVELVGAIAIIVGIWTPSWAAWAGILLAVTMLGAVAAHIRGKDPAGQTVFPLVLLIIAVAVTVIHSSALGNFPG